MERVSSIIRILEHCRGDYKPITPLKNAIPQSTLYHRKDQLLRKGWLESDGKDRYRTTQEGLLQLEKLLGEAPMGLSTFYPPLAMAPTPLHRAVIELVISAIIARRNNLRTDGHLSFIVVGPTLTWKTSLAYFLCSLLGIDPSSHIINTTAESGKGLWLRRTSTGGVSYKREILSSPLVVFDEYQNASADIKKCIRLFTDGRKNIATENEQQTIEPVSVLLLNPIPAETLEERLGMDRTQIRRGMVCDLCNQELPDLVVKGEEALNSARAQGPLELPEPTQTDLHVYRSAMYNLFVHTLNSEGQKLVNLESLVMLCAAMTAFKDPEEAIRLVFYNALILYEALGWAMPSWQQTVRQFPNMPSREEANRVKPADEPVSQEKLVRAFQYLKNGGTTIGLVTELGMTSEDAKSTSREYYGLEEIQEKNRPPRVDTRTGAEDHIRDLEAEVRIAKLRREKEEYAKPLELEKELETLKACLEERGNEKRSSCSHFIKDHCDTRVWSEKPGSPGLIGEAVAKGKRWFICPAPVACAACGHYVDRRFYSPQQVLANIHSLYQELGLLRQNQAEQRRLVDDNPMSGLYSSFKCKNCGATHLVAARIMCTKCDVETWSGWFPQR